MIYMKQILPVVGGVILSYVIVMVNGVCILKCVNSKYISRTLKHRLISLNNNARLHVLKSGSDMYDLNNLEIGLF